MSTAVDRTRQGRPASRRLSSPLTQTALLALAYFIAGRLGLLLAIPPGYATAIWPAAGIALAALLINGWGLWPGVAIGSTLVNMGIGTPGGIAALTLEKSTTAAAIGCGAAMQALVGYALTRGLLRRDPELLLVRNIAGLLILGGPLSCLVNPTVGVGVLLVGEQIVADEYGFSWMTWWVGDSMGVLICLPLLLLWLGPPKQAWAKYWMLVALPLALMLALSVVVFMLVSRQEQNTHTLEFEQNGALVARSLDKQLERSLEAVYSLRSFFGASSEVTRSEFGAFAGRNLATLRTVHALAWDPVVRVADRAAVEEAARRDGLSQYRFTELNARGEIVRAGRRPLYVVVQYIEPLLRNADVLGYDVYSQRVRREALDMARDSGEAIATQPLTLVQGAAEHPGLLVFVPVYKSNAVPPSLGQRRSELRGYAVGVFSSGELVAGALNGLGIPNLDVQLYDESEPGAPSLLVSYHFDEHGVGQMVHTQESSDASSSFSYSTKLSVAGRKWSLRLSADKAFVNSRRTWAGWGALVFGLLFSSLLGLLLLALTARRITDARRTAELAETNRSLSEEVAQRMRIEKALNDEKDRVEVTLHSIGDAVISTDAKAIIEYMNPAAERLTAWTADEARGKPIQDVFKVLNEETRQPERNPVERCLESGKMFEITKPMILVGRKGHEYAIADSVAPIRDPQARLQGAVLVFHDVTETHRMARAVEYQASHDSLTGLVNRVEFERRVERALASCKQYGRHHALCYLDLDQFKVVNDTCGHRAGDVLLRGLTGLLAHAVRDRDTLARLGGDEFGLLLENCPLPQAVQIAEALVGLVRDYRFEWETKPFNVGVSIGLVPVAGQVETADVLLAHADAACYAAKELGRNRVHVYQADDSGADPHHRAILRVTDIRTAIDRNRFQLFSQPIWTVDEPAQLIAHELLLRMIDNTGSIVQPGFFIPVAERFGLMDKIDRWVIEHSFSAYHTLFPNDGAPNITINLSGNLLGEEKILRFLHEQFETHNVEPSKVCFEITETAAIRNISAAKLLIKELRTQGCKFALDDFGSGLSSFGYLKALPVDYLKIDGSLVRRIAEESIDRAMVEAINRLAHQMGMRTIAEHVESTQCLQVLREIGVDHAQGYALGIPMRVYQAQTRPAAVNAAS
ncbi:MAG TPA: EAL domain-containing protein [Polyangiales bacterium]|nr:EAL domain-containing protein [Polyangiales bacterium]